MAFIPRPCKRNYCEVLLLNIHLRGLKACTNYKLCSQVDNSVVLNTPVPVAWAPACFRYSNFILSAACHMRCSNGGEIDATIL